MGVKGYSPETYWDDVAEAINTRDDTNVIAGDDEPYYRHKRKLFLDLFGTLTFEGKRVLEVGSGPGGNLAFLTQKGCADIVGVDVSQKMVALSRRLLSNTDVHVHKIDGSSLPFDDRHFDLVFTSTVLQHNTDETQLRQLIRNICRVSRSEVVIFERIERTIVGHATNLGRPVDFYRTLFSENGFHLMQTRFLPIQASYLVCGMIRKVFNKRDRKEGEPATKISQTLQAMVLPVTCLIDKIVPSRRDLGMLSFKREIA